MINHGKNLTIHVNSQPSEVNNDITTYFTDPEIYKQTGEQIKTEGERVVVPKADSTLNTKKLREDITTIEQFNALGNTSKVAKLYGVSEGTVHGHKIHLQAKAKAEGRAYDSGTSLAQSKFNIAKMKTEIKTLAEFDAVGSCSAMANKYDISKTAANEWQRKLRKKGDTKKTRPLTSEEIENFFGDDPFNEFPKVEVDKITLPDEQKGALEQSGDKGGSILPKDDLTSPESVGCETEEKPKYACFGLYQDVIYGTCTCDLVDDCKKAAIEYFANEAKDELPKFGTEEFDNMFLSETKDDLQGLAEPEPAWGGGTTAWDFSEKALDRIAEEIKKPETDEEIWNLIFDCVSDLRDRGIKKVDTDIQSRLRDMVGGMK